MLTAIVTGAGGFIGGALTMALLKKGYTVYGVDIRPEALERFKAEGNFIPVCIDLDGGRLSKAGIAKKIDVMFYLAWGGALKGADLYNTDLQLHNIKTAVDTINDIKGICDNFLFCSSSYEYMRDMTGNNIPVNIYGSAKGVAAAMCAAVAYQNAMRFNKIILTNTFGVGDRSDKAVNTIIRSMLEKRKLTLVKGDNKNDWTYIDDTINGILAVAEKGRAFRTYYIGHRNITTFKEKIIVMKDVLCPDMPLEFGGMEENTFVDYSLIDLDALYNDTGFECRADFKESIVKTARYIEKEFLDKKISEGGGGK